MKVLYETRLVLLSLALVLVLLFQIAVSEAADKGSIPAKASPITTPSELRQPASELPIPAPSVTLSAVTASLIRVTWPPVPGATRYVISRNGAPDITLEANAGSLQDGRYGYVDGPRAPATLHTYNVTAHFPAPMPPSKGPGVQLLTPAARAPSNFRATLAGPDSITLTWTSRTESNAGYRLIRRGGNLPEALLNASGATHIDRNLPPGEYSYTLHSVIRLADGREVYGQPSNPVVMRTRPFNVIAIGDSVMWGQGLRTEDKFATKASLWIKSQLGKAVNLRWQAHSGAITYPEVGQPVYENRSYHGEVPADWPTISHQIALAGSPSTSDQVAAADIDLILIDGCANNVGIETVLNPFGDDGNLRRDTRAYCGAGMTNILTKVVTQFPNADVVLTGYYPFVSEQSDLAVLLPMFELIQPSLSLGVAAIAGYRARATVRSNLFFQESNDSLQSAVDTVNALPLAGRTKFNQIRHARLNPGPNNSYGTSDTWQWLIPMPLVLQDDVFLVRAAQCDQVLRASGGNPSLLPGLHPLCVAASMGHPNVAGAQAYTNAIKSIAAQFMPQWRSAHSGPVSAVESSVIVRAEPGSMDASGGWIAITATEGSTGTPLDGTVQFDGVAAGPLGTPIRYAYRQTNPSDITALLLFRDRPAHSFSIPARKFSVSVEVTKDDSTRTALVTATDTASGQLLSGTAVIRAGTTQAVTGRTGQPLTYAPCGTIDTSARLFNPLGPSPQIPCLGTVSVPFYADVSYQDLPEPPRSLKTSPRATATQIGRERPAASP